MALQEMRSAAMRFKNTSGWNIAAAVVIAAVGAGIIVIMLS
jgi:hypothetical protein